MKFARLGAALLVVLSITAAAAWSLTRRPAAPPVAYTLLDGSAAELAQLRGKVVMVNFWATSCAVCVAEMPMLAEAQRRFAARGYETLAVAMRHDPPALVARFAETRALPFGVAIDNTGRIAEAFGGVEATPTSFLLDRHGRIVERFVGAPGRAALQGSIEKLLAEG